MIRVDKNNGTAGGRPLQVPKNSLMERKRLVGGAHPTTGSQIQIMVRVNINCGTARGRSLQILKQALNGGNINDLAVAS